MLRLTLLLSATMIGALMVLGEDRGQLRPGLANGGSEGSTFSDTPAAFSDTPAASVLAAAAPILAPDPVPEVTAPIGATAKSSPNALIYVEPQRELVQAVAEPIFTLSSLGNELVPGERQSSAETAATMAPEDPQRADGTIWYVTANSVNVRAEPSTDAKVLGKLGNGEAALMVAAVDADWGQIVIQGDGLEGYVALRYLTPEPTGAP